MAGVEAKQGPQPASRHLLDQPLQHRSDPGPLGGGVHGNGTGPGRFPPHVEDVDTGLHHGRDMGLDPGPVEEPAAVGERVRGDVDDAHPQRDVAIERHRVVEHRPIAPARNREPGLQRHQRRQHEAAAGQVAMGNGQPFGLDAFAAPQQDVDVDGAGRPVRFPVPSERPLDLVDPDPELLGGTSCGAFEREVEVGQVPVRGRGVGEQGGRLHHRRHPHDGQSMRLQRIDGPRQVVPPIPEVRAQPQIDPHAPIPQPVAPATRYAGRTPGSPTRCIGGARRSPHSAGAAIAAHPHPCEVEG